MRSTGREAVEVSASSRPWGAKDLRGPHFLRLQRHRTSRTLFPTASLLAVMLVSLATAYSLLVCYRHLSHALYAENAPRVLASNTSGDDKGCTDSPNDGNEEDPAATAPPPPAGEPVPHLMPAGVQHLMANALHLLAEAATRCRKAVPFLTRRQRYILIRRVTLLAALELSGFAFLPFHLQPLRRWVARQYLDLSSTVLNIQSTGASRHTMSRTLDFIRFLGEPPLQGPLVDPDAYGTTMVAQLRLFQLANYNVLNTINETLWVVDPSTGMVPEEAFRRAERIFEALYDARVRQILANSLTRHWLLYQQVAHGDYFFVHPAVSVDPEQGNLWPIRLEYQSLLLAVQYAGGTPVSPFWIKAEDGSASSLGAAGGSVQQSSGPAFADSGAAGHARRAPPHKVHDATRAAAPLSHAHHASSAVRVQRDSGFGHSSVGRSTPAGAALHSSHAGVHGIQQAGSAPPPTSEERATGGQSAPSEDDYEDAS